MARCWASLTMRALTDGESEDHRPFFWNLVVAAADCSSSEDE